MKNYPYLRSIVLIIIMSLTRLSSAAPSDPLFTLNAVTTHEILIRFRNDATFEWIGQENYPDRFSRLNLEGSKLKELTAVLVCPYYEKLIALPAPQKPKIAISGLEYETITLDRALQASEIEALRSRAPAIFTNTGFFGNVPAGLLEIYPIQPGEDDRQLKLLRAATVRIDFSGIAAENQSHTMQPFPLTQSYRGAFLNEKSAAQWLRPQREIAKQTAAYPSGQWQKITVKENGIHYLTSSDISEAGSSTQNIDINRLFLYSNSSGGRELPSEPGMAVPENLTEIGRSIFGDEDGLFNSGDTIIFWGRSSSGMDADTNGELNFSRNHYSFNNYYWLLIADSPGSPKEMTSKPSLSGTADITVSTFEKIDRHEVEASNFLRSGKRWYGEKFNQSGSGVSILFQLPGYAQEYPAQIKIRTKGANDEVSVRHKFVLYLNQSTEPIARSLDASGYGSQYLSFEYTLTPGLNLFRIDYTSNSSAGQAYVDFMELRYQRELRPENQPLEFWGPRSGGSVAYEISNNHLSVPLLFEITDWKNVRMQEMHTASVTNLLFTQTNDIRNRSHYYLSSREHFLHPEEIVSVSDPGWNTLRSPDNGADYIIITSEEFLPAAQDLAKIHTEEVPAADRLSTFICTQAQIVREFNADLSDPLTIRLFLKYAYENWTIPPQYVVLIGDGTYDYRGISSSEYNFVYTYQVENNNDIDAFTSYATDARFAYIHGSDKLMDVGIGRIPCRTVNEAQNTVDKIRDYLTRPLYGAWRNRITLVADDPVRPNTNEPGHIQDSENSVAANIPDNFILSKLYLLEYPEVQDASTYGVRKPAATEAILNALANGTTIINYLGHGSATIWAQEHVLEMERDIGSIRTGEKLPLWIAATCSWGHFDDINEICMPEALLGLEGSGAIAALAATRLVYANTNADFVEDILQRLFPGSGILRLRMGDLVKPYINGGDVNNEKYVYFGDPALYLALPTGRLSFSALPTDTLKSLASVSVSGAAEASLSAFHGNGILTVFDSDRPVTRSYLDAYKVERSLSYVLPGELLFKGNVNVVNGTFSSRFFVPKDLNYQGNSGKMNLYAWDDQSGMEISGYYGNLIFEGSESIGDSTGPQIRIGFKNRDFFEGDIITPDIPLEIKISDPFGINIAGKLGHNIILQFDTDEMMNYQVTEYFSYDADSDSSGSIEFPLPELTAGEHQVVVTAWDNANNSSTVESHFVLSETMQFELKQVVNFPNPFRNETDFTFYLTQPGQVSIQIFTVRGLLVKEIESEIMLEAGFQRIYWDGRDDFGSAIARGIYLYKIHARTENSEATSSFIGKMVKAG